MQTSNNLDEVLKPYGVKHIFIETGNLSIAAKIEEMGLTDEEESAILAKKPQAWCELSWTSEEDGWEAALNAFGQTPGEAIKNCLEDFHSCVKNGIEEYVEIAAHHRIYGKIMGSSK